MAQLTKKDGRPYFFSTHKKAESFVADMKKTCPQCKVELVQDEVMLTRDEAETMVTMLDAGWMLVAIAAHFGVEVKEVEQAIVKQVKSERNQGDDRRRGK